MARRHCRSYTCAGFSSAVDLLHALLCVPVITAIPRSAAADYFYLHIHTTHLHTLPPPVPVRLAAYAGSHYLPAQYAFSPACGFCTRLVSAAVGSADASPRFTALTRIMHRAVLPAAEPRTAPPPLWIWLSTPRYSQRSFPACTACYRAAVLRGRLRSARKHTRHFLGHAGTGKLAAAAHTLLTMMMLMSVFLAALNFYASSAFAIICSCWGF